MSSVRHVTYYDPFTHYFVADVLRVFTLGSALIVFGTVVLLAWHRWHEDRKSASLFLTALSLSLFVHAASGLAGLGRPPVWWLLYIRLFPILVTFAACYVVIGESKRGVWARREG